MGRLELILGPMFAGKTSELIRIIKRFRTIGKEVMVVNHSINDRYGGAEEISSHACDSLKADLVTDQLTPLIGSCQAEVIVVEEGQFFSDVVEFATWATDVENKTVIVAGLSGDYLRRPFPSISALIPLADSVQMLRALCKRCSDGTEAIYTRRTQANQEVVQVGASDIYEATCRRHYLQ